MLSIDEAFRKFKSRLELNEREQKNASQRQNEVRDYLQTKFGIARSFLTGSYARYTKTKPLKDIDIFFVLKDSEKHYHGKAASVVLDDFHSALVEKYGSAAVRKQARSINVDFGVHIDAEDNTDYRVVSVDAVPAFDTGDQYEIPDTASGKWIKTDPEIHKDKATAASLPRLPIEFMTSGRIPPDLARRSATIWMPRASSARSSCCSRRARTQASPSATRVVVAISKRFAPGAHCLAPSSHCPDSIGFHTRPIEVQHVPVVAFPAPVVPA